MNRSITSKETENLSENTWTRWLHCWTFTKSMAIFFKLFQKIKEDQRLSNSFFYDASTTQTPKPDKDTTRKKTLGYTCLFPFWFPWCVCPAVGLLDHQKSKRVSEKHLLLLYWLHKAFDYVDHNKLWKILQEMGIPDHLTYLLRNLYAGQEATVSTRHGTKDCLQTGKGVL